MTITDPAEYRRIHDIAAAAYEAAVPVDYRYSALALRKAVDAALSALAPQAGDNAEEPVASVQIQLLEERVAQLEDELYEAEQAPWPDWTSSILKNLKKNGYDPVDTDGTVDLGEAFADYLEGIGHADEDMKKRFAEKDAEIERRRSALASHPCTSTPVVSQNAPDLEDKGGEGAEPVPAPADNVALPMGPFAEVAGFGASYQHEGDRWIIYTMPGPKRIGEIDGYDKARLDWIIEALRAAHAQPSSFSSWVPPTGTKRAIVEELRKARGNFMITDFEIADRMVGAIRRLAAEEATDNAANAVPPIEESP